MSKGPNDIDIGLLLKVMREMEESARGMPIAVRMHSEDWARIKATLADIGQSGAFDVAALTVYEDDTVTRGTMKIVRAGDPDPDRTRLTPLVPEFRRTDAEQIAMWKEAGFDVMAWTPDEELGKPIVLNNEAFDAFTEDLEWSCRVCGHVEFKHCTCPR